MRTSSSAWSSPYSLWVARLALALFCAYGVAACSDDSPEDGISNNDSDAGDSGSAGDARDADDADDASEPLEGVQTRTLIEKRAIASWNEPVATDDPRPVLVFMPGWGGNGSVDATVSTLNALLANEGYVTLAVGFDSNAPWDSNLPESVLNGLDALCADDAIPARCDAIALVGTSYGGSQNFWVTSHLRGNGYDGTGGKEVLAFLSEDAGYAPPGELTDSDIGTFNRTGLADAASYSVAMIENQGDLTFPIDACTWGNCGIRVLARAHADAGHDDVLSKCPEGGGHGTRGYADWNAWVVSAIKTMLHEQRGIATFAGYTEPQIAVGNDCR